MKQQNFESWGRAATIPGLQLAVDMLQEQLDQLRSELFGTRAELQRKGEFKPRTYPSGKRMGRPPKIVDVIPYKKGMGAKWDAMTPEQRSAEMKRRQAVARANRIAKGLPPARRVHVNGAAKP
jgi:hypothetical protein